MYRKTSNISRNKSQNLNNSHLALQLSLPNPLMPYVKLRMETGDAPTASELSTILLPTKVWLILEVLW